MDSNRSTAQRRRRADDGRRRGTLQSRKQREYGNETVGTREGTRAAVEGRLRQPDDGAWAERRGSVEEDLMEEASFAGDDDLEARECLVVTSSCQAGTGSDWGFTLLSGPHRPSSAQSRSPDHLWSAQRISHHIQVAGTNNDPWQCLIHVSFVISIENSSRAGDRQKKNRDAQGRT